MFDMSFWLGAACGAIGSCIGALVGFLLAMWHDRNKKQEEREEKAKKAVVSIIDELEHIKEVINKDEKVTDKDKKRRYLSTPAWNAVLGTGIILERFGDEVYDYILAVYSFIEIFNSHTEPLTEDEAKKLKGLIDDTIQCAEKEERENRNG